MAFLRALHKILTHPMTIIADVALGFVAGFRFPEFSGRLKPASEIYVSLLSMCLLPILVSALVWGVGQILRARETQKLFGRMALIYGVGLFIPCVVGIGVALVFEPVAGIIVLLIHVVVLAFATRTAPWRPLVALKTPLILAFATAWSWASEASPPSRLAA